MKKLILVYCSSLYPVEHNCKDFKTGKFKFEYEVDGVKVDAFERNDSIEIENFEGKIDTID
jgi:hypothetical protein